jgi:dihydrofolate reductase
LRKVIAGLFTSIDGVVDAPHQWNTPYLNEQIGQTIASSLAQADLLMLATKTYKEFAAFWPHQTNNPLAGLMNNKRKCIVSNSLKTLEWQNSTLISGKNLVAEVIKLKEQAGNDIWVPGSPALVRSLIQADLLDQLRVIICPVVVGAGARLFDDITPKTAFKIADAMTISTGAVQLTYVPVNN